MSEQHAVHEAAFALSEQIARALRPILPRGFRGRIEITLDQKPPQAQDVAMNFRPPQPRPKV